MTAHGAARRLAALGLGLAAWHAQAGAPATGDAMSTIEAQYRLSRSGAPYAFEEDVVVELTLRNRGTSAVQVPSPARSSELRLRLRPASGPARETTTLVRRPGMAAVSARTALAAGQQATFALPLQLWFGPLAPGRYAVEAELRAPELSAASGALPFEVLAPDPGAVAVAVSPSTEPQSVYVAWVDRGARPARLLWRHAVLDAREQHARAILTRALADAPADAVALAAPSAPPGADDEHQWVAWSDAGGVTLVEGRSGTAVATARLPPEPGLVPVGPLLSYSEPAAGRTTTALLLAPAAAGTQAPIGLELDAAGHVAASHRLATGGPTTQAAVTHLSRDRRWVAWSEGDGAERQRVRVAPWGPRGFGVAEALADLPGHTVALAAKATATRLWVAALLEHRAEAGGPPALTLVRGRWAILPGGIRREGEARATRWKLDAPVSRAVLAVAADGRAWALVDAGGARLLGTSLPAPVPLSLPPGARAEAIVLVAERHPSLVSFDPVRGWAIEPVALPADAGP